MVNPNPTEGMIAVTLKEYNQLMFFKNRYLVLKAQLRNALLNEDTAGERYKAYHTDGEKG